MKKVLVLIGVVCLAAVSVAGSLRSEIEAMNKKIAAAMKKKDIDSFSKLVNGGVTKDFKYTEYGKSMGFDEMVGMMKQSFATISKVTVVKTTLISLKEKGNSATATQKHEMATETMGQDKKVHKMTFSGISTDVFRKEGGVWKMASMTFGKQSMTMDGKPMDMSKMGG